MRKFSLTTTRSSRHPWTRLEISTTTALGVSKYSGAKHSSRGKCKASKHSIGAKWLVSVARVRTALLTLASLAFQHLTRRSTTYHPTKQISFILRNKPSLTNSVVRQTWAQSLLSTHTEVMARDNVTLWIRLLTKTGSQSNPIVRTPTTQAT